MHVILDLESGLRQLQYQDRFLLDHKIVTLLFRILKPTNKRYYFHGAFLSQFLFLGCPSLETVTSTVRCTRISSFPANDSETPYRFVRDPDRLCKPICSSSILDQVESIVGIQSLGMRREPRARGVQSELWLERLLSALLKPSALKTFCRMPDSMMSFERQGTLKMKKPQVISASAQNRRGPIK